MMIQFLFLLLALFFSGCNAVPPDTAAPSISEIHAGNVALRSATIIWGTDEAADARIEYGTTSAYGSSTPLSTPKGRAHSQSVTGLEPGTRYHYRVLSRDAAGNLAASADNTFTTLSPPAPAEALSPPAAVTTPAPLPEERVTRIKVPDFTPPSVPAGLAATASASSQFNLTWSPATDDFGVAGYRIYRNGKQIGTTTSPGYSDKNLASSTSYSYSIAAYDAAGNVSAQSNPVKETTPATPGSKHAEPVISGTTAANPAVSPNAVRPATTPPDTFPPSVPTGMTAAAVSPGQINVAWNGSEDNVGVTGYRLYRNGIQVATVRSQIYSDTHLEADTIYRYRVGAEDAAGNVSAPGTAVSARTLSAFSGIGAAGISQGGATINWTTLEPTTAQVEYGTTTGYGSLSPLDTALSTGHSVSLIGLTGSTRYHYRVISRDASGNVAVSADQTFSTPGLPAK